LIKKRLLLAQEMVVQKMDTKILKYTDEERPPSEYCACYDCGLLYQSPYWAETILENEDWELVSPSIHKGSGLLCFTCICERLDKLGLKYNIKTSSLNYIEVDKSWMT
jgi:hypothetical protein